MIEVKKQPKKNLLYLLIRNVEGACKSTLKDWSGLSMESVIRYVDEMRSEGLICTKSKSKSVSAGRKATYLSIRPEGCYFIGVCLGTQDIRGVVLDAEGQIRHQQVLQIAPDTAAESIVQSLRRVIAQLMADMDTQRERVRGIGISIPGLVDREKGVGIRYVHIPGWNNIRLRDCLEGWFSIPVTVEHKLKSTALAVGQLPENQCVGNLMYLLIGRGIGMAILKDGEIFSGAGNLSGEIGHIFAEDNGIRCRCGRIGCLETVAGTPAILQRLRLGMEEGRFPLVQASVRSGEELSTALLQAAALRGDSDACALLEKIYARVGEAVATSVTLLNPEKIVFAGDLGASPGFSDRIIAELEKRCFPESLTKLSYAIHKQDMWFDVKAAAMLAYERLFGVSFEERNLLMRLAAEQE